MTHTPSQRAVIDEARAIKRAERKAAKKRRPANPKATRGRVIDKPYLAWLRRQPCFVCMTKPSDAAHIRMHKPGERPTGLARKSSDRRAVPLCRSCHMRQHSMSEAQFWDDLRYNPFGTAEVFYRRFRAETDG